MQKHKLSLFEKLSFSLAGMGQNIIYNYIVTAIMFYYTDVALIDALAVSFIMFFTRIWDAINDPIMGVIVDKTRTKRGKLRPYLLAIPIPIAVFTIMAFAVPDMSMMNKIVYAVITFNLWSMAFTVTDIPFWGMSVAITDNSEERVNLVTMVRIFCNIGMAIGILVPPMLINALGGSTEINPAVTVAQNNTAYFVTAVIVGLIGASLFSMAGLFTKERVIQQSGERPKFKILFQNRPLLILQLSRAMGAFRMVIATVGLYFAKQNLNDASKYTLLGGTLIASMIFSMFFAPWCIKTFGKKNTYIYSLGLGAISHFAMFAMGYGNEMILFGLLFLCGISLGINDVTTYSIVGDTVDYLEYKTGQRAEGMVFSLNTFTTKLQSAMGLAFIGIVLSFVGYQATASVQSALTYQGIFALLSLFPGIACILSIIPMFFYKFTAEEHERILEELHPTI